MIQGANNFKNIIITGCGVNYHLSNARLIKGLSVWFEIKLLINFYFKKKSSLLSFVKSLKFIRV